MEKLRGVADMNKSGFNPPQGVAEALLAWCLDGSGDSIPLGKIYQGVSSVISKRTKRNLELFLEQIKADNVSSREYENYLMSLNDPEKLVEEITCLMEVLIEVRDDKKPKILSCLFVAYIMKYLKWDEFIELSDIIQPLFINDVEQLRFFYTEEEANYQQVENQVAFFRLQSLGLVRSHISPIAQTAKFANASVPFEDRPNCWITDVGKLLFKYGILAFEGISEAPTSL